MENKDLKFRAVLDDAFTSTAKKIQGSLGGLAAGAGLAMSGMAAFQKSVEFATASIEEFKESEMVVARLSATIKAVGDRTSLTADTVQKFATQMQSRTIFGDEAVMNAERIMLTMQNISDEIIPLAIEAAANMADSEEELASKAFALGKALESPAEGFAALRRSGMILGDQTEKMIKQLMEEGRIRDAQCVLLKEVEKRYGGVAEAMAKTATGEQILLKNKMGDEMERLGQALMPVQTALINLATSGVRLMTFEMDCLWLFLKPLRPAFQDLATSGAEFAASLRAIGNGTKQILSSDQINKAIDSLEKLNQRRSKGAGSGYAQRTEQIKKYRHELELIAKAEAESLVNKQAKAKELAAKAEAESLVEQARTRELAAKAEAEAKAPLLKNRAEEAQKIANANYEVAKKKYEDNRSYVLEIERDMAKEVDNRTNKRNAEALNAQEEFAQAKIKIEEETAREAQRIELEEARVKESIEQAKRNSIVSTGKTMFEGLVSSIKLAKQGNKQTKEDALKMAVLQGAIAHAGAAASIWSTMGGSWQEKLVESIAVSASLFTAQAVEIASINKQNFATGGIVQGASSGDNISVKANGGEMFLTKSMQQNLLTMAQGQGSGGGASIVISPTVKVDSGMTAGERDRMVRATAESVRNAMIHLVQTNRVPAGLAYR